MTPTTNYGLKKIDSTDNWREIFADHNDSMDLIDAAINSQNQAIAELVQESAFRIVQENFDFVLYWYGAQGECPYAVALDGTDYVLNFNYTY